MPRLLMEQMSLFEDVNGKPNRKLNQSGFIQDEEGRECTKCRIYKEWENFCKRSMSKSGYNCVCKKCAVVLSAESKRTRTKNPKIIELFNQVERKYVRGDVDEEGNVFVGYIKSGSPKKNFESWMTRSAFERMRQNDKKSKKRASERLKNLDKKYKRGDEKDGLIFWSYHRSKAFCNFEEWVDKEKFELLLFSSGVRSYINNAFKKFGGKESKTFDIIGISDEDLRKYIESLFEDGMTWENRGNWEGLWDPENPKWHLDHIFPLSAAKNKEEAQKLWHYTNLRPMWGNENLSKLNKHDPEELERYLKETKVEK